MKPLVNNINLILTKIFRNQHPLLADIIINWNKMVGLKFSTKTSPIKITRLKKNGQSKNILHVQVDNSVIALEMSFQQDLIIERISIYLGFNAIYGLRVIVRDAL